MALVVPATDLQGTVLQNTVNSITTLIAANPLNIQLQNQLAVAQANLVQYLVANGNLVASAALANGTYVGDLVIR